MTTRMLRFWPCLTALCLTVLLPAVSTHASPFATLVQSPVNPVQSPVTLVQPPSSTLSIRTPLLVPSQYPTIQAAVDASQNGDTVQVADGTYTGIGNRDIDFHSKNITVTSQNGPAKTIIDCGGYISTDGSGNHRGFYIHSGETNVTIIGFTVQNGYEAFVGGTPDSGYGGGICNDNIYNNVNNSSRAITLTNCTVTQNTAQYGGGGIYNGNNFDNYNYNAATNGNTGTITLTNCNIISNTAFSGGGVGNENVCTNNTSYSSTVNGNTGMITLTDCNITGNTATGGVGGGVYNNDSINTSISGTGNNGQITLTGCTVTSNTAQGDAGGVYNVTNYGYGNSDTSTIALNSCIITGNNAPLSFGGTDNVLNENDDSNSNITLAYCTTTGSTSQYGYSIRNINNAGMIVLADCTVSGNAGVGVDSENSNSGTVTLTNCIVSNNAFGITNINGGSQNGTDCTITLTDCLITGNVGEGSVAGGVYNDNTGDNSTIMLADCTVTGSVGGSVGGGGGGISNYNDGNSNCTIALTNCIVSRNIGLYDGGGVFNYNSRGLNCNITLTNCTLTGNSAQQSGGGVYNINYNNVVNTTSMITLTNDVVYGDSGGEIVDASYGYSNALANYCDIQYSTYDPNTKTYVPSVYPGMGNINADPLFVNAAAGDLHLMQGSPCIGKGTPTGAPVMDKDGELRDNPPSIGAYEPYSPTIISAFTLSPNQITAPGPTITVTANVEVTGKFSSMIVTCAPGSLNNVRSPKFYLTTSDGLHWTGTFSTAFLKDAKANPVVFVATGTRPDGTTSPSLEAYLTNGTSLPPLLVSLSPDHSNVGRGNTVTFTGGVADTTAEPAWDTNLQITLPPNVQYVQGSAQGLFFNKLSGKLYESLPLNPNSSFNFSFQVTVNADVPSDTDLTFLASAICPGFQAATTSSLVTVDGGIPTDVVITNDMSGLLAGDRSITSAAGSSPLTATLTLCPQIPNLIFNGVSRPNLWFSVTNIEQSDSVTYAPDIGTPGLLAQLGLISPSTSPEYVASFLNKGDYLKAHVGWTQESIALSLLEALSVASGKVLGPDALLNKSNSFLSVPGISEAVGDILAATSAYAPNGYTPKAVLQPKASSSALWTVALARAYQLLTGDNGDGEKTLAAFLTALESNTISPAQAKAIAKRAWSLGSLIDMVYEFAYIVNHTNSNTGDLTVEFSAK